MPWADAVQHELEANPQYNKLLRAFRLFDKNGDGFMDAAELRDLLQRVNPSADPTKGDPLTEADCAAIISSFDDNGDGQVNINDTLELLAAIETQDMAYDLNGDGEVNNEDGIYLLTFECGLTDKGKPDNSEYDMNQDGVVDDADVTWLEGFIGSTNCPCKIAPKNCEYL